MAFKCNQNYRIQISRQQNISKSGNKPYRFVWTYKKTKLSPENKTEETANSKVTATYFTSVFSNYTLS